MYLVLVCLCTSIEYFVVIHYNFILKPHNFEPQRSVIVGVIGSGTIDLEFQSWPVQIKDLLN